MSEGEAKGSEGAEVMRDGVEAKHDTAYGLGVGEWTGWSLLRVVTVVTSTNTVKIYL